MTDAPEMPPSAEPPPPASTLPFAPGDLMELRVLPSQFARMVGISKQAVSKAIQAGRLTLGPDGRLDPKRAVREYMETTHPARVRARVFRSATADLDELRRRLAAQGREVQQLRAALDAERQCAAAREAAARAGANDDAAMRLGVLIDALGARLEEALAASRAGAWEDWSDALVEASYYARLP